MHSLLSLICKQLSSNLIQYNLKPTYTVTLYYIRNNLSCLILKLCRIVLYSSNKNLSMTHVISCSVIQIFICILSSWSHELARSLMHPDYDVTVVRSTIS